jgi:hypothetical protein
MTCMTWTFFSAIDIAATVIFWGQPMSRDPREALSKSSLSALLVKSG